MKRLNGLADTVSHFRGRRAASGQVLPPAVRERIRQVFGADLDPAEVVSRIIRDVRDQGDKALHRISAGIDGVPLSFIEVPPAEIGAALDRINPFTRAALEEAAERIRAFQRSARIAGWRDDSAGYGEIVVPLRSVGTYVPGGTAPLASTVLMTAVPARVAGVDDIFLVTPAPGDTLPHTAILAAAAVAGVDRVFKVGGAQAIAALAHGTETVPAVDFVCGPGNVFVTTAKKQVFGDVGIDGLYGPTETLIVVDETADAAYTAADLLAQAEHDAMAQPVLISTSAAKADEVAAEIERQIALLPRKLIAGAALRDNGILAMVSDVDEAIEAANEFAPEHMCLMVKGAERWAGLVRNAGGLFLGEASAEVMADYVAGPSHVMPTGGTARFASALSVRHFQRIMPFLGLDEKRFLALAPSAAELARTEDLHGHAAAAEMRRARLVGE